MFRRIHQHGKIFNGSHRLLAAKSTNYTAITAAMRSVQNILDEVTMNHVVFCTQWGISERELEGTPESTATTAYGAYIMDIGFQGDGVKLIMALAACLVGYGEVGLWLFDESKRPGSWVIMDESSNPYVPWIKEYSGEMYQKAVEMGLGAPRAHSTSFLLNVDDVLHQRRSKVLGRWHPSQTRDSRSWPRSGGSALRWKKDFGIWQSPYPKVLAKCCRITVGNIMWRTFWFLSRPWEIPTRPLDCHRKATGRACLGPPAYLLSYLVSYAPKWARRSPTTYKRTKLTATSKNSFSKRPNRRLNGMEASVYKHIFHRK